MNAVPLFQFMPYGAPELQSSARQHMIRALILGTLLCTSGFVLAGLLQAIPTPPPARPDRVIIIDHVPPPPSIREDDRVPIVPPAAAKQPVSGIPVLVPEERVPIEPTFASQDELRRAQPGIEPGAGTEPPLVADDPDLPPDPRTYVYVEELPTPIHTVNPEYPAFAREAGVSGLVLIQVLVDRDGHVRDARLDPKRNVPMLNDAALAAARQWTFKPALANNRPVAVWVAVPFNFRLQ
jgi:protein TonB